MNVRILLSTGFLIFLTTACAPKIYVTDRQTVLEEEAAGDWPQFEKELIEKSQARGPAPFGQVRNQMRGKNARQSRIFNVLNGDLVDAQSKSN